MASSKQPEAVSVASIEKTSVIISLAALAGALFLYPTVSVIGGLVAGAIVGLVNFRLIQRLVVKLIGESEEGGSKNGLKFFAKIILLAAAVGILILVVKVSPLAFLVGFSSTVAAILFEGLKTLF